MATVEAYLDNDGNVTPTAEQLFTHRHTVRYRLERVKELCGHDITSTEGREKLGLGLKAMRVLGIPPPRGPALGARHRGRPGEGAAEGRGVVPTDAGGSSPRAPVGLESNSDRRALSSRSSCDSSEQTGAQVAGGQRRCSSAAVGRRHDVQSKWHVGSNRRYLPRVETSDRRDRSGHATDARASRTLARADSARTISGAVVR